MPLDYSKWENIEVSDDEDDTHPNIHTPYLFRLRHDARLKRMKEINEEKDRASKGRAATQQQLKKAESEGKNTTELVKQLASWTIKENEVLKKEEEQPWNVDTISEESFSKSRIAIVPKPDHDDPDVMNDYAKFVKKYETDIKQFGMMRRTEDSQQYLGANPHLMIRYSVSYMNAWCVDLIVEGKNELMEQIAYQAVTLQFILEVSKHAKMDIRGYAHQFFETRKRKNHEPKYQAPFDDEMSRFMSNAKKIAQQQINAYEANRAIKLTQAKKNERLKKFSNDYSKFNDIETDSEPE